MVKESSNVSSVTLVIGTNAPHAVVASSSSNPNPNPNPNPNSNPDSNSGSGSGSAASASASSTATISAEARNGDENVCSDLPSGQYGGHP
ncbi:hypothetical protein [Actinospica sp.]|uniref:hypothetical protein n=1 Tax=Actinospica sp. TaxID=1872142 RepID=UPI002C28C44F|nr:hypothetical protein [Actinospica sp.]HWG28444.1 hypothetical protein [Actinospica sp.]